MGSTLSVCSRWSPQATERVLAVTFSVPSPSSLRSATSPKGRGFSHFRKRLSLLVAQKVPTVWNTCTMSTSSTTQTIMMLVW